MPDQLDLYDLRRREVQALGAALSCRDWYMMETAYNSLRDKLDNAGFTVAGPRATPSQRLDAATVERCEALRQTILNVLPSGNDRLPGDKVIPFYIRMDELRAIRALATEPHQHGAGNGEKHGG